MNPLFSNAEVGDVLIREGAQRPVEFSYPILFEPTINGVKASPLEFRYDMTHDGEIYVGPSVYTIDSFIVSLWEAKDSQNFLWTVEKEKSKKQQSLLLVRWPRVFIESGTLSVINNLGAVLWELEISEKEIREWHGYLEEHKDLSNNPEMARFFESTFGVRGVPNDFFDKVNGSFRFCLSAKQEQYQSSICTQRYSLKKDGNFFILKRHFDQFAPQVFINQKMASLKGSIPIIPGDLFSFFAQASNGIIYETVTSPIRPNLLEMVDHPEANEVSIYGYEPIPQGEVDVSKNDKREDFFTRFLWGQTIGDLKTYWRRTLGKDKPFLYYPGYSGAWFVQEYNFPAKFPSEKNRIYISNKESKSTYSDSKILHGYMGKDVVVTSQQREIMNDPEHREQFIWEFDSPKMNDWNRSTLVLRTPDGEFGGLFEVYKGYNKELSGRLSGVFGKSGSTFLGEMAFNWWFEDFFGTDSHWFTKQRWGLSTRVFNSMAPISFRGQIKETTETTETTTTSSPSSTGKAVSDLDAYSVDLRYRFTPGIWGRDESWGAVFSSQNVLLMGTSMNALGGGIFWARSMPPLFDRWLREFPLMQAPKFVDLDFSLYPVSLNPRTKMGLNYSLNFHGKIFWTHSLFGEAAFSWKTIQFVDQDLQRNINFSALFLTVGMGVNF